MDTTTRQPAVAGVFYPGSEAALDRALVELVPDDAAHHRLLACIAPHAGYLYSGGVAGRLFGHLEVPRRVVVLGPNHTGAGEPVAVAPHTSWSTPAGPQIIDSELAERLLDASSHARLDDRAHRREHSIEVQLPFLRRRRPDVVVLPISLAHLTLADCAELGGALAAVIDALDEPVGIVASSDMSHYVSEDTATRLDHMAIEAAVARDPEALYDTVHRHHITMCGVIPATVALAAANTLGATDAHLVAYATSGDVTRDSSSVVGYAGVCVHR